MSEHPGKAALDLAAKQYGEAWDVSTTPRISAQGLADAISYVSTLEARLEKAEAERDEVLERLVIPAVRWDGEPHSALERAARNEALEEAAGVACSFVWAMYERSREDGNFVLSHDCDRVMDAIRALKSQPDPTTPGASETST